MADSTITISEARRNLASLVEEVGRTGNPVTLTRHDAPVARIVPVRAEASSGLALRGHEIELADDFDAPLDELWEATRS